MASKSVSIPFKLINGISVSGTSVVTSSVSNILYRDSAAIQISWTGNPQGTLEVQGSVDFSPTLAQSGGRPATPNVGTWTALTLSATPTVVGSTSILINMTDLAFSNLRTVYTNTSGSGVLTGWIVSKSVGV